MPKALPLAEFTLGQFTFLSKVPIDGFGVEELGSPPTLSFVERGQWARHARPLAYPGLHRQFAGLKTIDQMARFAGKYGLLSRGTADFVCDDPDGFGFYLGPLGAEKTGYWGRAIARMAALIQIWDLIRKGDVGKLGQIVIWFDHSERIFMRYAYTIEPPYRLIPIHDRHDHRPGFPGLWLGTIEHDPGSTEDRLYRRGQLVCDLSAAIADSQDPDYRRLKTTWRRGDPLAPAESYLVEAISQRLLHKIIFKQLPPTRRITMQPDSLLAAMYLLFALEVAGQKHPNEVCLGCGESFTPGDPRQRYCTSACQKRTWDQEDRAKPSRERRAASNAVDRALD